MLDLSAKARGSTAILSSTAALLRDAGPDAASTLAIRRLDKRSRHVLVSY